MVVKTKKNLLGLFFQTFVGEYVSIVINMYTKVQHDTEEGVALQESPMNVVGYLLDIDEEYYYLGEEANSIQQAVKKDVVAHIEILQLKTAYDDVLDAMADPETEQDFN